MKLVQVVQRSILMTCCLVAAFTLGLSGCRDSNPVRNTEGIKACMTQEAQAEGVALLIKRNFQPTDSQYIQARDSYTRAAGDVNGFLQSTSMDVEVKRVVDIPADAYNKHDAAKSLGNFINEQNKVLAARYKTRGSRGKTSVPVDVNTIVELLKTIGGMINQPSTNSNNADAVAATISDLLRSRAPMLPFDQISDEAVKKHWENSPIPPSRSGTTGKAGPDAGSDRQSGPAH